MKGYIKLYRKIKENKYWLEPRRFSKAEAWIDLLLRAGFKDKELVLGDLDISLKAGAFVTSQIKLAEAWNWNRETVNKYLKRLKNDKQIDYKTSNKFTIITIINWDSYQNPDKEKPTPEPTTPQHQDTTKTDTINNDNNENKNTYVFNKFFKEDVPTNPRPIIKKIAEWMHYPVFKPQKSLEETEAILGVGAVVNKCGLEIVCKAFKEAATGANPSVKRFWEIVKEEDSKGK